MDSLCLFFIFYRLDLWGMRSILNLYLLMKLFTKFFHLQTLVFFSLMYQLKAASLKLSKKNESVTSHHGPLQQTYYSIYFEMGYWALCTIVLDKIWYLKLLWSYYIWDQAYLGRFYKIIKIYPFNGSQSLLDGI